MLGLSCSLPSSAFLTAADSSTFNLIVCMMEADPAVVLSLRGPAVDVAKAIEVEFVAGFFVVDTVTVGTTATVDEAELRAPTVGDCIVWLGWAPLMRAAIPNRSTAHAGLEKSDAML